MRSQRRGSLPVPKQRPMHAVRNALHLYDPLTGSRYGRMRHRADDMLDGGLCLRPELGQQGGHAVPVIKGSLLVSVISAVYVRAQPLVHIPSYLIGVQRITEWSKSWL